MKKALTVFFVVLGVIFFLLLLSGALFYIVDPLNIKPLFFENAASTTDTSIETTDDKNPLLSSEQEEKLERFGIDPATLPSEITAEQEACFEEVLGTERMAEIKAGDTPTVTEFFSARDCV